jgi:hypothetical protein
MDKPAATSPRSLKDVIFGGKNAMKRLIAPLALLLPLLAACDSKPTAPGEKPVAAAPQTPATPVEAAFQHDPNLDVFGYYLTQTTVKSGNWQLKSINMGSPSDFASWEDGKHPSNFGPFFMEFEDVSSPTAENELGQVYHTVSFRLQPDSYKVGAGQVTFHATDRRIGEVVFSGGFDLTALKAVKAAGPGVEATTVLTGGLQIGAERIRNISFFYFAGD